MRATSGQNGIYVAALILGTMIGSTSLVGPWLSIIVALGIVLLFYCIVRPIALCFLLIAAVVLTSGMQRGAIAPLLKPNELAFLMAGATVLAVSLIDVQFRPRGLGYFGFSILLLGVGTVLIPLASYLLRKIELSAKDLLTLAAPLQYFLIFWVFSSIPKSHKDLYKLMSWMVIAGSLVAVIGLLQAANLGFVQYLLDRYYPSSHGDVAADVGRVTSLLGAWNATGIFLMTAALVAWGLLKDAVSRRDKSIMLFCLATTILALVATGSFTGIITLVVGIVLLSLLQRRGTQLLPMLLLCLLVIVAAGVLLQPILIPLIEQRFEYQFSGTQGQEGWIPQTLSFRFRIWSEFFWPAIRNNLIWGVRPTIPSGFGWHAPESQYIFLLFSFGMAGLASWIVWWFGSAAWALKKGHDQTGLKRSICNCTVTLLVVMVLAGFTNAVFTFAGSIDYLWMLLGLTASTSGFTSSDAVENDAPT